MNQTAPKGLWTEEEKLFKRKDEVWTEIRDLNISFKSGLMFKLSKSVFGPFLKELNPQQTQDYVLNDNKLQIFNWELKRCTEYDKSVMRRRNSFLRDYQELLKKAVNQGNEIDLDFLRKHLKGLYLDCCFIKRIDNSLKELENICVLTLCGNFLRNLPGALLPRKLAFLELCDNLISDLSNLTREAPPSITHLGLGRNRLTNGSQLHLLGLSENFTNLKSIDLSDNDICNLESALNDLKGFTLLLAFSLEGNPCSVEPNYRIKTLEYFLKLRTLDFTQILPEDREDIFQMDPKVFKKPEIGFCCYRIVGLPPPPKEKKAIQTIHLELDFPLLNEGSPQEQQADHENDEEPKKHKKSYYAKANEYNHQSEKKNAWLKTERQPWSKMIQFQKIHVRDDRNNFSRIIRDTFRGIVPVAPYSAKTPKNKKGKKAAKPISSVSELTDQKEVILKKITLASFYCELKSLNWSDQALDFYWADHPMIGRKALRVAGSLQGDYFIMGNPKKNCVL